MNFYNPGTKKKKKKKKKKHLKYMVEKKTIHPYIGTKLKKFYMVYLEGNFFPRFFALNYQNSMELSIFVNIPHRTIQVTPHYYKQSLVQ